MTTIVAKPLRDYPWFIRLFFWKQRRTYGRVLDPGLLWGRSPWVFASVALLYGALDRRYSPIAPALRSLVTVRVSQINHCAFCIDINSATLAKRGVPMEKIDALPTWQDSSLFDVDERLARGSTQGDRNEIVPAANAAARPMFESSIMLTARRCSSA